ncbi:MAG: hypothetical protein RLQ73_11670 [Hoeflea sp. D1-CHI-28]
MVKSCPRKVLIGARLQKMRVRAIAGTEIWALFEPDQKRVIEPGLISMSNRPAGIDCRELTAGSNRKETHMLKLAAIVYILVASVLAGSFVVAALTIGRMDALSISGSALAGALVALPVAWFVAGKLNNTIRPA